MRAKDSIRHWMGRPTGAGRLKAEVLSMAAVNPTICNEEAVIHLLRIAQEAIQDAVKHASASHIACLIPAEKLAEEPALTH